ncbi:nuclease [Rhizopus stolonifer]|uniref:Endonuclease n=1 Tax=Rhizopus stolonifer TaxID=4846 RepID=A0A367KP51_RHIST|nr:nuclease [Rhizopus stolonifer]
MSRQRLNFSLVLGGFFFGILLTYTMVPSFVNHESQHAAKHQTNHGFSKRAVGQDILKFGNPGPVNDLLERTEYTISYNRRDRIAYWAGEHLTAANLVKGSGVDRDNSDFKEDTSLPSIFRSHLADYKGSGYDRGHQAPAGDAGATQAQMDETFLLSNMAPQVGVGFNREYWAYFEAFCRDLTQNFTDVYVFTGPLLLPQTSDGASVLGDTSIKLDGTKVTKAAAPSAQTSYSMNYKVIGSGGANVAVPTHFFKVLLTVKGGKYTSGAFVLPNQAIKKSTALSEFQVDLSSLQKASGLQFFTDLSSTNLADLCATVKCVV